MQEIHRRLILLALCQFIQQLQLLGRGALLQHLDQRQGNLSLAQVVICGLARVGRAAVVENIVLNLERHTDSLTEAAHLLHILARCHHRHSTHRGADADQAGRLFVYYLQIVLTCGVVVGSVLALQHLALAERGHRADDVRHQVVLRTLHTERHRASQDVIAQDHSVARLPQGVDRGTSATRISRIDHIVVNKRYGVQHLHHHSGHIGSLAAVALTLHPATLVGRRGESRSEHNDDGTNALAARVEDV